MPELKELWEFKGPSEFKEYLRQNKIKFHSSLEVGKIYKYRRLYGLPVKILEFQSDGGVKIEFIGTNESISVYDYQFPGKKVFYECIAVDIEAEEIFYD